MKTKQIVPWHRHGKPCGPCDWVTLVRTTHDDGWVEITAVVAVEPGEDIRDLEHPDSVVSQEIRDALHPVPRSAFRDEDMDSFDYSALDSGIRDTVKWLHRQGFETTDSGDGSKAEWMEGALDIPHVAIRPGVKNMENTASSEAHLAQMTADLLEDRLWDIGVRIGSGDIQVSYDPYDGSWVIMLYATIPDKSEKRK